MKKINKPLNLFINYTGKDYQTIQFVNNNMNLYVIVFTKDVDEGNEPFEH